jgi:hypothetical protein
MPIVLQSPVVIPSIVTPERTADKLWILGMHVFADNPTQPVTCQFDVAPFNSSTGEVFRNGMAQIPVADVLVACANNEKLATALQAIYAAVEELCKERLLFGLTPDPITPTISIQPQAVQIDAGLDATFTITASGYPLNYQWRKNGVNIDGETSSSFTITFVDDDDEGVYDVVVGNGIDNVTSDSVELTVTIPEPAPEE